MYLDKNFFQNPTVYLPDMEKFGPFMTITDKDVKGSNFSNSEKYKVGGWKKFFV